MKITDKIDGGFKIKKLFLSLIFFRFIGDQSF